MKKRLIDILAASFCVLMVGVIAYSQLAPRTVTAEDGDSNYTNVIASGDIQAGGVIVANGGLYDHYGTAATGKGIILRTFAVTLSSGSGTKNYGAGKEPIACSGYYNQSTIRSFAINFGHVAAQRTMTIALGGGGATGDAVAGTCWVVEAVE